MWGGRGDRHHTPQQPPPRHRSCPIHVQPREQLEGAKPQPGTDTSPPLGMGHFGRPPGSATQPCSGTTSVPPGGPSLLWSHSTLHRGQHASPRREIRLPPSQPAMPSPAQIWAALPGQPCTRVPCAPGWGCLPCTLLLPGRSFLLPPPRIPLPPSLFSVSLISANGKWAPSLLGKLPGGCRPGTGYKLPLESLRGGGG